MSRHLTLIVPGDPAQLTGGYLFDARIVTELERCGWDVEVMGLAGRFPDADARAGDAMRTALESLGDGERVVIDGLALGAVPDSVAPHSSRLDLTGLVHHPLADETGLDPSGRDRMLVSESRALAACRRVIVTSPFTARRLRELHLYPGEPFVVEPGVAPADLANPVAARLAGNEETVTQRLLCVASLTPRKGQDLLVRALSALRDFDWTCVLAGSTERDTRFAASVRHSIEAHGLEDRVDCLGECDADRLAVEYRRADVCLLPSHYEGYGMVVSEALARGLPLITTRGGALAETAPDDCCLKVAPGDVEALRDALARWLGDSALRRELTGAAVRRREALPRWSRAAEAFAAALNDGHH